MEFYKERYNGRWLLRFIGHSDIHWGVGAGIDIWFPGIHVNFGKWMLMLNLEYSKDGWQHLAGHYAEAVEES